MTPVTNAAAREASNRAGPAMSIGWPQRPIGVRSKTRWTCVASARARAVCSVMMKPGAIALTRTPSAAQAAASDLGSWATPARLVPPGDARAVHEHVQHRDVLGQTPDGVRIGHVELPVGMPRLLFGN